MLASRKHNEQRQVKQNKQAALKNKRGWDSFGVAEKFHSAWWKVSLACWGASLAESDANAS